jgi:hypothetical protein
MLGQSIIREKVDFGEGALSDCLRAAKVGGGVGENDDGAQKVPRSPVRQDRCRFCTTGEDEMLSERVNDQIID